MSLSEPLRQQIADLVTSNRVVLFMKGTLRAPQCGFSAQVVQILDELLPGYETVDVLRSPEIRDGIKQFSEWPTIPQLYVGGEFIGGCDIVREMNTSEARLSSARRRRQLHSQYANPAAVATASSQTTCFMQKV